MKNIWFIGVLSVLMLFLASIVSAADNMTVAMPGGMNSNPGSSDTGNMTITAGADLSSITYSIGDLTGQTDSSVTIASSAVSFSPTSISALSNGSSSSVAITVAVPNYTKPQYYNGTVTISATGTDTETQTLTVLVNSYPRLDVQTYDNDTPLTLSGEPGDTDSKTFTIKNEGNENISTVAYTYDSSDFADGDNDTITLTFSPTTFTTPITPSSIGTVTVTADIGDDVDIGVYEGTVTVSNTVGSITTTDTFALKIKVQPEVCEDGIVGKLDITDIDLDESKYAPDETIEVEVDVKNKDSDEMEVVVEAFLYDINDADELVSAESESIEIDDGKTETFILKLRIPKDVDTDNDFVLYVKAYEDGDEDDNCYDDSVDVEVRRLKHHVIVDSITLTPSTAKRGEEVSLAVYVENLGTKDEDGVTVRIVDTALGLDKVSEPFDLERFDDDKDNAVKRFAFKVPKDAADGDYSIEAIVTYDDGDETSAKFATFKVLGSVEKEVEGKVTLDTSAVKTDVEKGRALSIPVTVTSSLEGAETITLTISGIDAWAEPVPDIVQTLNKGQPSIVYFYLQPKDTATGQQSATIEAKVADKVAAKATVTFAISEPEAEAPKTTGFAVKVGDSFKNDTMLWVIGDIVLVVVAVFLIKVLFLKKH